MRSATSLYLLRASPAPRGSAPPPRLGPAPCSHWQPRLPAPGPAGRKYRVAMARAGRGARPRGAGRSARLKDPQTGSDRLRGGCWREAEGQARTSGACWREGRRRRWEGVRGDGEARVRAGGCPGPAWAQVGEARAAGAEGQEGSWSGRL